MRGRGSVWDAPRQIPFDFAQGRLSPAGENAGLRDDLIQKKSKLNHYLMRPILDSRAPLQ